MLKHLLLFLFSFLWFSMLNAQEKVQLSFGDANAETQEVRLYGKIIDQSTNETLPEAIISTNNKLYYAIADEKGNYELILRSGIYELEISYLGYETLSAQLTIYEDATYDFQLSEGVTLGEVTVSQKKKDDNVTSSIAGIEQLSIEQLERQSKLLGETDVLRSLQSISGVSSTGEGASGFNVRGGNTDENLIFQDGNLIMNPVHALGFFSLFHPDMVDQVTLYKGGVPAKYGGRLSSVLDVRLREGDQQKFSIKGGVGLATSRLALEGPIIKNKVSFIIGGRASYFDWILKQADNLDVNKSEAFFYDLTAKVDARLSPTTKFGFSGFATQDEFQFSDEVKFDYSTTTGAVYLKQIIGEKINLNANLNIGSYQSSLFDIRGTNQSQFNNQIDYARASLMGYYQVNDNYSLEVGAEQNRYTVSPGKLSPLDENSSILADELPQERGQETALFLENKLNLGDKIEILAGLRYTIYQSLGADQVFLYDENVPKSELTIIDSLQFGANETIIDYTGFEPRLAVRYLINEQNSIKLNYNRSFQFFSQISNTASATPIDIWQLSNYHIRPQRADNFSVGYYRNFQDNSIQTNLTLFYRTIQDLIEYKDFAQLLLNPHIETDLLVGEGRAYGLEVSFTKSTGKHQLDANYTYSRSLRQIVATTTQESVSNGNWYPSNFDKPHIFNLNYFIQTSEKTNLSINFTYSTGRPTTAPVSAYSSGNILSIPVYSERNQYRIPDFHRLDVAYTIGPWGKKAGRENSITLSIYNVYFRKNAFSVFFRQLPFQSISANRVAVLGSAFPAITYNFKF